MRTLIFFITFITLTAFGQETKTIKGKILDSLTKEPVAFANIQVDDKSGTTSDFNGNFKLQLTLDNQTTLDISAKGYKRKFIINFDTNKLIVIKLVKDTFDLGVELKIRGKPLDTSYYPNKQIKKVNYQYREQITFYESGKLKSKTANESTRQWYENGNLKYQTIFYTSHSHSVTEWYENGLLKAHGTSYWGKNEKTDKGDWFKSDDWRYWNKDGKEIKK